MTVDFVRCRHKAITPTQGTSGSASYDVYSVEEVFVQPSSARLIQTGFKIRFKIPISWFGKVHSQSSWSLKFTSVGAGVINFNHRGPVIVIFFNFSDKFLQIREREWFA